MRWRRRRFKRMRKKDRERRERAREARAAILDLNRRAAAGEFELRMHPIHLTRAAQRDAFVVVDDYTINTAIFDAPHAGADDA